MEVQTTKSDEDKQRIVVQKNINKIFDAKFMAMTNTAGSANNPDDEPGLLTTNFGHSVEQPLQSQIHSSTCKLWTRKSLQNRDKKSLKERQ